MGTGWDGTAAAYATSFGTLCAGTTERVLGDAAAGPLLDVGTGTGRLAALAARRGHDVLAVDADPGMVALAAGAVPGRVLRARLPRLPLRGGTFTTTTANFVVNHVADPRAAVRELARVTRPGGRVAMTSWTASPPGWGALVGGALDAAEAVATPTTRLPEELDFERTPAGLAGLAQEADLSPVEVTELRWTWEVTPAALWRGVTGGVAGPGRTYLAQTVEVRDTATALFRRASQERAVDGVLRLPAVAAYVLAER